MCEDLIKKIYHISKESNINQIVIITNHLKFAGTLCKLEECKEGEGCILTLNNAKMWRIEDICTCGAKDCKCNDANFCSAEWLNINVSKIVAFTLKN